MRIAKDETMFCYPENIAPQMELLFRSLKGGNIFREQQPETFIARLAHFLAELNAIHPFREGNGRTQLSFAGMIGDTFDQPLHLERVTPRAFLPAMIASYTGNLEPLIRALRALRQ